MPELAVWIFDLDSGALRCSAGGTAMFAAMPPQDRDRFDAAVGAGMPFDIEIGAVRIRASRIDRVLVGTCEIGEPAAMAKLITNLSHDLNNPLAAAMANLELIGDSLDANGDVGEMVDDALKALRRMRTIIAGLRGGSHTEQAQPAAQEAAAISRVLVVDDEVLFTNVVHRVLREHHDVTICNHTDDAVARFEAGERFDAIVCDLMMPRIGGMGLYARVAELAPDQVTRFVFVTAGTTTAAAQEFLRGRTNPKLEKPCDFKELRAVVARVTSAKSPV